uniref:Activin_recp domain-containing protein n=1 Tax=Heterorhabditis bacteriophora TaxID=37862 RepID=A0A1I7XA01_HETBA
MRDDIIMPHHISSRPIHSVLILETIAICDNALLHANQRSLFYGLLTNSRTALRVTIITLLRLRHSILRNIICHNAKQHTENKDCDQVTCFCDRESCDDKMLCQGDFCVIGVRRDDNGDTPKLRQHCGTLDEIPYLSGAHSRCEERIDNWQEVCKCEEDLCNTFVYLRSSFDSKQDRKDLVSFIKQDVLYPPVHHRPYVHKKHQQQGRPAATRCF